MHLQGHLQSLLRGLSLVALIAMALPQIYAQQASGTITLTTTKKKGETLELIILASNNRFSVEGASQNPSLIGYTLEAEDGKITIHGDIEEFDCNYNSISQLDISQCPSLTSLNCSTNLLTSLNCKNNTQLKVINCIDNNLKGKEMDELIASLPRTSEGYFLAISELSGEYNICTQKQVAAARERGWEVYSENIVFDTNRSKNTIERKIYNGRDEVRNGTISMTTALPAGSTLKIQAISIGGITVEGAKQKSETEYTLESNNGKVTIKGQIYHCYLSNNQLTWLDVSQCPDLDHLDCRDNRLTSLDLSQNVYLGGLSCYQNRLTTLDLSRQKKLFTLFCEDNQLSSLDLSQCPILYGIQCHKNNIKGKAMSQLVESLTERSIYPRYIKIYDNKEGNEHNECTQAQTLVADRKNWSIYWRGENQNDFQEYTSKDGDLHINEALLPHTRLSPNPTHNVVCIESATPHSEVRLYNSEGVLLLTATTLETGKAQIEVSTLPRGKYFVEINKRTTTLILE